MTTNLRPYTVKHSDIMRDGKRVVMVFAPAPTVHEWCDLLNDAYQAGVKAGITDAIQAVDPARVCLWPKHLVEAAGLLRPEDQSPIPIAPETEVPFPCWVYFNAPTIIPTP